VAYELAEKGQHLPAALQFSEKGVGEVEAASRLVQLGDLEAEDLARMRSLGADWDTLGWIHFRLGNLARAEDYVHAAWILSQSGLVGDHLGQIYQKQGKRLEAIRTYAQALAAKDTMKDTRERLRSLLGSTAQVEARISRARSDLSQMRTIRLPRVTRGKATAEFFLLFSPGPRLEEVQFISGDQELAKADVALKAARFDVPFPSGSSARIVRRGLLMCTETGSGCDFVLFIPDTVRTIE
ncbi:MAG: hypothetical protein L0170_10335, partial [Acidobacteria bacterium]|nr:hypothetical protein [Acidobacteriota bacterium]